MFQIMNIEEILHDAYVFQKRKIKICQQASLVMIYTSLNKKYNNEINGGWGN